MVFICFLFLLTKCWRRQFLQDTTEVVVGDRMEERGATESQTKTRLSRIVGPCCGALFKRCRLRHDGGTAIGLVREHDLGV